MVIAFDALTLLARAFAIFMLILVTVELTWAMDGKEPIVERLRDVWMSMLIVLCFPFLAALDELFDLSPGFALRGYLSRWVWVAYGVYGVTLVRLWVALRTATRTKIRNFKD